MSFSSDLFPALDCQLHLTIDGPFVLISATMRTLCGNASQATFMAGGSTRTSILVTIISGGPTAGSSSTFPVTLMKSTESQQLVDGSLGLRTYNQVTSAFLPMISACRPMFKAPMIA